MDPNDPVGELKEQASDVLDKAGDQISEHASQLQDLATDARYRTEDFIQTNPWTAVGIALGIGFIFGAGLALGRRRK
jgi:ElaB/YqjD/DUF883 family membrane-anchored ribosome-binding protein